MKVLVTGATGFIGSNLVRFLTNNGNKIFCVLRDSEKIKKIPDSSTIHTIYGDLNDISTIRKLPKTVDVIIHSAAMLGKWDVDEKTIFNTNVQITESLLEWFSYSECRQFVFLSTPGVQGLGYKNAKEILPYNPRGLYENTKVIVEKKIRNYRYKENKAWTIVRPDFVYGPDDLRRIKLYKRIKKGLWINIGNGKSVLRPTYVVDLCKALMMISLNPSAYFQIFNIAGPELITSEQYIKTIAKILDAKIVPIGLNEAFLIKMAGFLEFIARISKTHPIATKSQIEFLTQDHGTDISKIKKMIGFSPEIDFESGMRRTLKWAESHQLL